MFAKKPAEIPARQAPYPPAMRGDGVGRDRPRPETVREDAGQVLRLRTTCACFGPGATKKTQPLSDCALSRDWALPPVHPVGHRSARLTMSLSCNITRAVLPLDGVFEEKDMAVCASSKSVHPIWRRHLTPRPGYQQQHPALTKLCTVLRASSGAHTSQHRTCRPFQIIQFIPCVADIAAWAVSGRKILFACQPSCPPKTLSNMTTCFSRSLAFDFLLCPHPAMGTI